MEWIWTLDPAWLLGALAAVLSGGAFLVIVSIEWGRIQQVADLHAALADGIRQERELLRGGMEIPQRYERIARFLERLLHQEQVLAPRAPSPPPPPSPPQPPPAAPPQPPSAP